MHFKSLVTAKKSQRSMHIMLCETPYIYCTPGMLLIKVSMFPYSTLSLQMRLAIVLHIHLMSLSFIAPFLHPLFWNLSHHGNRETLLPSILNIMCSLLEHSVWHSVADILLLCRMCPFDLRTLSNRS